MNNEINPKYATIILVIIILCTIAYITIPNTLLVKEGILKIGLIFSIFLALTSLFVNIEKLDQKKILRVVIFFLFLTISYMLFLVSALIATFYLPGNELTYETEIKQVIKRNSGKSSLPCLYNGSFTTDNNKEWLSVCISEIEYKDFKNTKKLKIKVTTKENLFGYTVLSYYIKNEII